MRGRKGLWWAFWEGDTGTWVTVYASHLCCSVRVQAASGLILRGKIRNPLTHVWLKIPHAHMQARGRPSHQVEHPRVGNKGETDVGAFELATCLLLGDGGGGEDT
jgi:hypothetical protein